MPQELEYSSAFQNQGLGGSTNSFYGMGNQYSTSLVNNNVPGTGFNNAGTAFNPNMSGNHLKTMPQGTIEPENAGFFNDNASAFDIGFKGIGALGSLYGLYQQGRIADANIAGADQARKIQKREYDDTVERRKALGSAFSRASNKRGV